MDKKEVEKRIEIGKRVKEIRKRLKLNQKEFGEPMALSASSISAFEKGAVNKKNALAIAKQYSLSERWLIDGVGEIFEPPKEEDADKAIEITKRALGLPEAAVDILKIYASMSEDEKRIIREAIEIIKRRKEEKKEE